MPQHRWAFERGILYASDMESSPISPRLPAVFKEFGRESVEQLAAAMDMPDTKAVLTRFATGRRCFGAWIEGRLAAYGWVSRCTECIGEQEREIQMSPHEAYIWDCATRPEYRGQRLYSALLSQVLASLREEGVRRVWIGTALANEPSLRGFINAGFRPVLTLIYARFLNVHGLLELGHPAAPPALVASARNALTLNHERAWGPVAIGWTQRAQPAPCAELEA